MEQYITWISLVLSIIAIILAIIAIIWVSCVNSNINNNGISLNVQNSTEDDQIDIMKTGGNNLYIAHNEGMTIEIEPNKNNKAGKEIYIKNNTKQRVHIDPSKLDSYDGGNICNKLSIGPNHTAKFIFIGKNSLLRLS